VQLGVASGPIIHTQIKTLTAFNDQLSAIVGAQHPFAQRRDDYGHVVPVTADQLAAEEFIVARWGPAFELFMSRLSDAGHRPSISMEIGVTETAKALLKMNMGVSVLPHFAIYPELNAGVLVEVPILNWEPVPIQIALMHRRDRELSLPSQRFLGLWKQSITHYPFVNDN
jgi:DNA-binding transcriptional LysR family regulator